MQTIVLVHGWGFDRRLWDKVLPLLRNFDPILIDLGFTGNLFIPNLPDYAFYVGHSLGMLWLLQQDIRPAALLSIQGFDCFYAHVPQASLSAMQTNLKADPARQMQAFYQTCRAPRPHSIHFNPERLAEGLDWLAKWDARDELASLPCPVHALAADKDAIVSREMSEAVWEDYDLTIVQDRGHVLPLTAPDRCAAAIERLAGHGKG